MFSNVRNLFLITELCKMNTLAASQSGCKILSAIMPGSFFSHQLVTSCLGPCHRWSWPLGQLYFTYWLLGSPLHFLLHLHVISMNPKSCLKFFFLLIFKIRVNIGLSLSCYSIMTVWLSLKKSRHQKGKLLSKENCSQNMDKWLIFLLRKTVRNSVYFEENLWKFPRSMIWKGILYVVWQLIAAEREGKSFLC